METTTVKLIGSEKQIAWAEDIRREVLDSADRMIREYAGKNQVNADQIAKVKAALEQEESAKWWIDNRVGTLKVKGRAMQAEGKL